MNFQGVETDSGQFTCANCCLSKTGSRVPNTIFTSIKWMAPPGWNFKINPLRFYCKNCKPKKIYFGGNHL